MISREALEKMSREELLKTCYEQNKKFDELRGCDSCLTLKMMSILDSKTLIDCCLKTQNKIFKMEVNKNV